MESQTKYMYTYETLFDFDNKRHIFSLLERKREGTVEFVRKEEVQIFEFTSSNNKKDGKLKSFGRLIRLLRGIIKRKHRQFHSLKVKFFFLMLTFSFSF